MHVYLVHAIGTNRYKIGITSRTISYRLSELNGSQSAYPLELITSIRSPNYKAIERHLHEKYSAYRVHGEWFEFDSFQLAEVQRYMGELNTQISDIKPILRPRSQPISSGLIYPRPSQMPFKEWLLPLLVGFGIVYTCHSIDFLKPAEQPTHSQKALKRDR